MNYKEAVTEKARTEGSIDIEGDGKRHKFVFRFNHPYPANQVIVKPKGPTANPNYHNVLVEDDHFELIFEEPPEQGAKLSFYYTIIS